MKNLPKIYQNQITKNIKNNKTVYRFKNEDTTNPPLKEKSKSIKDTLDEIFNGIGYAYNIPVMIKTSTKTYDTTLVARTENNIVTIDNELISIKEINSIEIKKDR